MTSEKLDKQLDVLRASGDTLKHLRLPGGFKTAIAIAVLVFVCWNMFFTYVRPDEYGIKVVRIGLNRGVQKKEYHAGLCFVLPFGLQQMYRLPKGIQVLELTNFPQTAAWLARKDRAAHIQTSDGFFVDVDVSILYHISNPYLVFTTIGPGTLFEENGIIPKAEPALKETLGKLTTEEYDQFVRDTVNFLVYVGEPAQLQRRSLGFPVIAFLIFFTVLAYAMKKEYWKDVK